MKLNRMYKLKSRFKKYHLDFEFELTFKDDGRIFFTYKIHNLYNSKIIKCIFLNTQELTKEIKRLELLNKENFFIN